MTDYYDDDIFAELLLSDNANNQQIRSNTPKEYSDLESLGIGYRHGVPYRTASEISHFISQDETEEEKEKRRNVYDVDVEQAALQNPIAFHAGNIAGEVTTMAAEALAAARIAAALGGLGGGAAGTVIAPGPGTAAGAAAGSTVGGITGAVGSLAKQGARVKRIGKSAKAIGSAVKSGVSQKARQAAKDLRALRAAMQQPTFAEELLKSAGKGATLAAGSYALHPLVVEGRLDVPSTEDIATEAALGAIVPPTVQKGTDTFVGGYINRGATPARKTVGMARNEMPLVKEQARETYFSVSDPLLPEAENLQKTKELVTNPLSTENLATTQGESQLVRMAGDARRGGKGAQVANIIQGKQEELYDEIAEIVKSPEQRAATEILSSSITALKTRATELNKAASEAALAAGDIPYSEFRGDIINSVKNYYEASGNSADLALSKATQEVDKMLSRAAQMDLGPVTIGDESVMPLERVNRIYTMLGSKDEATGITLQNPSGYDPFQSMLSGVSQRLPEEAISARQGSWSAHRQKEKISPLRITTEDRATEESLRAAIARSASGIPVESQDEFRNAVLQQGIVEALGNRYANRIMDRIPLSESERRILVSEGRKDLVDKVDAFNALNTAHQVAMGVPTTKQGEHALETTVAQTIRGARTGLASAVMNFIVDRHANKKHAKTVYDMLRMKPSDIESVLKTHRGSFDTFPLSLGIMNTLDIPSAIPNVISDEDEY